MRLMIGFSTTRMISTSPSRRSVTSANSPVANSAFSDLSTRSSLNGSPGCTSRYERTVSGSMRWVPSIRTSRTVPPPSTCARAGKPSCNRPENSTAQTQRRADQPITTRNKSPKTRSVFGLQRRRPDPRRVEMHQIVPGREYHQCQHKRQTDAETVFLGPLAKRSTANRLRDIKQQVPPVKDRDGKQVDQPEIDRKHRHKPDDRDDAPLRHFARHLSDAQRPTELVGGARADDHLPDRLQSAG